MTPEELIATRRVAISEGHPRRLVPTAVVHGWVPLAPLAELVDELNQPGRLLPGLQAEVEHLVVRAAARAMRSHPHLRNLLLPSGAGHEIDQFIARMQLDGPGSASFGLIIDPDTGTLESCVQELDAAALEGRLRCEDEQRKGLRQKRTRPIKNFLMVDGLGRGWAWTRDNLRLPPAWIRLAVQVSGNLIVQLLGHLGLPAASPMMAGPRLAQLVIGAPRNRLGPGGQAARRELPVAVAFDQRLFEPWEAAAYLADVLDLLAEPRQRLA